MNVTTEEPEPRRKGATSRSEGASKGDFHGVGAAYSNEEPPSGVLGPARSLRPGCCREC